MFQIFFPYLTDSMANSYSTCFWAVNENSIKNSLMVSFISSEISQFPFHFEKFLIKQYPKDI